MKFELRQSSKTKEYAVIAMYDGGQEVAFETKDRAEGLERLAELQKLEADFQKSNKGENPFSANKIKAMIQ